MSIPLQYINLTVTYSHSKNVANRVCPRSIHNYVYSPRVSAILLLCKFYDHKSYIETSSRCVCAYVSSDTHELQTIWNKLYTQTIDPYDELLHVDDILTRCWRRVHKFYMEKFYCHVIVCARQAMSCWRTASRTDRIGMVSAEVKWNQWKKYFW